MGVLEKESRLNRVMEEMPTNLTLDKNGCNSCEHAHLNDIKVENNVKSEMRNESGSETKIQLSFSVDRLLNGERKVGSERSNPGKCDNSLYCCCAYPNCFPNGSGAGANNGHCGENGPQLHLKAYQNSNLHNETVQNKIYQGALLPMPYLDFKSVVRPTPIRALENNCETVPLHSPFLSLPPTALMRFHAQKSSSTHPQLLPMSSMFGFKALPGSQQISMQSFGTQLANRFATKAHSLADIPGANTSNSHAHTLAAINHQPTHTLAAHQTTAAQLQLSTGNGSASHNSGNNSSGSTVNNSINSGGKRKRSWSRAVFSNLQRKGLEIQFQQQKYITKPDRRKLAARLNLTDAQVKVWFQNRRMKWRHTRENLKSGQEKQVNAVAAPTTGNTAEGDKTGEGEHERRELGYTTDDSSSIEMSDNEDDDEIDVVE